MLIVLSHYYHTAFISYMNPSAVSCLLYSVWRLTNRNTGNLKAQPLNNLGCKSCLCEAIILWEAFTVLSAP